LRIFSIVLKPQDILVTLKLAAHADRRWTYDTLASELGMSPSGVFAAVSRADTCGLMQAKGRRVIRAALLEFLVHGVRYVFPAQRGRRSRGMRTGTFADPLVGLIASSDANPLVWPYVHGKDRGESLNPLYATAPLAAAQDPDLYALLAVVDGIRAGSARTREIAANVLRDLLLP
jgi:hypothetical protein